MQTPQASYGADEQPEYREELRNPGRLCMLTGTLSSRVYLKQANAQTRNLIEKWLEPLTVLCAVHELEEPDLDYMRFLWKLWMENHPHDSICGCSQDAVHAHMMDRSVRVDENAEQMIDFMVADRVERFAIYGPDGSEVPYRIVEAYPCKTMVLSPINLPGVLNIQRFVVE